jgi:hypothetical protein
MKSDQAVPRFWDLLSEVDQFDYCELRQSLSEPTRKNRRNRSVATFSEIVGAVKAFVMRNNHDDWKRGIVCGLFWFQPDSTIAINTRQLRILISKCKSSINGSFQQLGYSIATVGTDCSAMVVKNLPYLNGNFTELRQWTLRQQLPTQAPAITTYISPPPDLASTFDVPEDSDFALAIDLPKYFSPEFDPLDTERKLDLKVYEDPLSFMPTDSDMQKWDDPEPLRIKEFKDLEFDDLIL